MCKGEYRVGQNPGGNVVVVSDSLGLGAEHQLKGQDFGKEMLNILLGFDYATFPGGRQVWQ